MIPVLDPPAETPTCAPLCSPPLFLAAPAAADDEVKMQDVDLDGLLKAVAEHKGKVVVIDVWGTF